MKKIYLANFSLTINPGESRFLPYSVGNLWAYAQTNDIIKQTYKLEKFFFEKQDPNILIEQITDPVIVGFSTYVWNSNFNDTLAKLIKEKYPNCLIVYGGPHVPQDPNNDWYNNHNYVDVVVFYEGEESFKNILLNPNKEDIVNRENHAVNINNKWFNNCSSSTKNRLRDLSKYPSPYTNDLIPPTASNHIMLIETNRGCPYACTFCDWGSLVNTKLAKHDMNRIKEEIEYAGKHKVGYLHMADANFGIYKERDNQIADWFIETRKKYGYPKLFFVNWAKNTNEEILHLAKKLYNADLIRGFNMSLQTLTELALKYIKRDNLDINNYSYFANKCKELDIPFSCELIMGNPGETLDSWKETYTALLQYENIVTELFPLTLLPNAEIATTENRKQFGFKTAHVSFPGVGHDCIPETMEVVISNNWITEEEMKIAWEWTWTTKLGHEHNIVKDIAKFLDNNNICNKLDFYNKFYDYIKTSKGALNTAFEKAKLKIEKYEFGLAIQSIDFRKGLTTWQRTDLFNDIDRFLKLFDLDIVLHNDLIAYSDCRLFDPNKKYPLTKIFNYNIVNYDLTKGKNITVEFLPTLSTGSINIPSQLVQSVSFVDSNNLQYRSDPALICTLTKAKIL